MDLISAHLMCSRCPLCIYIYQILVEMVTAVLFSNIVLVFFQERIAAPHLKRDYNALCNANTDEPRQKKPTSTISKILSWLLFWENSDSDATNRTEL